MTVPHITRRKFATGLASAGGMLLATGRASAAEFSMRQYHNQPIESPLHKRLTQMWDAVKAETHGRVQVEIFPENNHFKDGDPDPLDLLIRGELDFLTLAGNGLAGLMPAANIQATPFAFHTRAQVFSAIDGDLGDYLRAELTPKGVRLLPRGCFENGFHQITCATRPIRYADDLQGLKIRAPGNAVYLEFWKTLGAVPMGMNINKMYDALKNGVVEAQEDPFDVAGAVPSLRSAEIHERDQSFVVRLQPARERQVLGEIACRCTPLHRTQHREIRETPTGRHRIVQPGTTRSSHSARNDF